MRLTLEYIHRQQAQAGFCLIPICAGEKCPPRGFPLADALSTPLPSLLLSKYLEGDQDVAVVLGIPSGNLLVIDIDVDKELPFDFPETLTSRTRRGFHYFFRVGVLPPSRILRLDGTKIGDVLAAKHMCKLPPSRFVGGSYRWTNRLPPLHLSSVSLDGVLEKFDAPLPPPPPPRREVSHSDRYLLAKIRGEIGNMERARKGERNSQLVTCCVKLKEIQKDLWQPHLSEAALRTGLKASEVAAVFRWVEKI
jgi:hypothetical protein